MPRTEEQSQPREEKVEQQKEQEEQAPVTAAVASVALETLESLPAPLKKLATAPPSETESEDDDSEVSLLRASASIASMKACCRRRGIEDRAGATDFFAAGVRTHIGGGLVHDGGHTKLSALDKGALQSRVQILAVQRSQQQLLQRHLELSVALQRGRGGGLVLRIFVRAPSPARLEQRRQQQQPEHHHFRFKATCVVICNFRQWSALSQHCLKLQKSKCRKKFANMLPEDVVNDIKADAKVILHETGCLVG
ncbi:hypothetical protein PI125_g23957 [Phytophthora idaei]|nr:hypothetical protein PI125_g23957 [Phytophthora idaei]